MEFLINPDYMDSIQGCREISPHSYLGPHQLADGSLVIRSYFPQAKRAWVEFQETGAREDMISDGNGFYHYVSKDEPEVRGYKLSY